MGNESLSISFSESSEELSSYVLDSEYVRLEQVIPIEKLATVGEVAELLEQLYEINPCSSSTSTSPTAPSALDTGEAAPVTWGVSTPEEEAYTPFDLEEFKLKVSQLLPPQSCLTDVERNWFTQVKVILSDPDLPYTLRLTNGIATKTVVVEETYSETIEVTSAKGILLAYPIVTNSISSDEEVVNIEDPSYNGEITFKWNGSVITEDGGAVPPPVTVIGNTLYWGIEVSGSLTVKYPTKYFLVDITVFATSLDEQGSCSVICFYEKMVDTLNLEKPDDHDDETDDNCSAVKSDLLQVGITVIPIAESNPFIIYRTEWKCQCSGDHSHYTYSPEPTQEQRDSGTWTYFSKYVDSFGGYVDCGEVTGDINTEEFYIENCCYPPEFTLPQCEEVYRKNNGGARLDTEEHDRLLETYGDQLRIIYVSPEDGDCGTITTEQVLHSIPCCDEIVEMTWDENNCVDFIPDNSQGGLAVFDGAPIKTWISNSPGAFFNSQRTAKKIVAGNAVTVYTDEDACGMLGITVDDGCIKLNREIQAETGAWVRTETWTKWLGTPRPEYGDTIGFDDLIDPLTARIIIDGRTRVTEHVDNNYYGDRILGYCYDSNQVCCYGSLSAASGCGEQDEFDCAAIGVPADDTSFDWGPTCRTGGAEPDSYWFDGMYSVAAGHPWGQIARKSALGHICGCEGHQTVCSIGHWYQYVSAYIYVDEWQC